MLLTYCQRQKEKAEKANNQDDALAWSEAVQLSKITIDCMNSAVTQQEFWNASQSWQEVIISSKFATHALIQSIATKDQESSDWKKMSHGYEETSKLGINAALAYQAGRKEEGQRFDQEARKTWVKILDLSKY